MTRVAFLDRDGVINEDRGYVFRWEAFTFIPGAIDGMRMLQDAGYRLAVVTNQSGIARGFYSLTDYEQLMQRVHQYLLEQGVELAAMEACPHLPEGVVPEYALSCDCRKPEPGMILRAGALLQADLAGSVLIGDKLTDIKAAHRAGVGRAFLVGSGSNLMSGTDGAIDGLSGSFPGLLECARFLAAEGQRA